MSEIVPVTMYRYRDKVFESPGEAIDHAEELVVKELRQPLLDRGFTLSETVKVFETIFEHRKQLVDLLDYELETDE